MVTCAIDLGKFKGICCLFDITTQDHQFETIETKRSHIENLLKTRPDIDLIVMEACGPSGWINDICEEKTRRKKAGIALARKIGVVAWAMMRDQTDWDASKVLPAEEAKKDNGKIKAKRREPKPPGPVHSEEPSAAARRRASLTPRPPRQTRTSNRRIQTPQLK